MKRTERNRQRLAMKANGRTTYQVVKRDATGISAIHNRQECAERLSNFTVTAWNNDTQVDTKGATK